MVTFQQLWRNHPAVTGDYTPCATDDVPNFENQCAIRLGAAISASGISLANYPGAFCWHGHGKTHPLRVEELKQWLDQHPNFGRADRWQRPSPNDPPRDWRDYEGQTGIIACLNFYGAGNQGDHIDLWNRSEMAYGSLDYIERSEAVWFWRLN